MPSRTPIQGSERPSLPDAKRIGDADPTRRIQVTVTLPRRSSEVPTEAGSRADFAERYGADPADIDRLEEFATEHGLDVVDASPARRTVILGGTIENMSAAFGTELGL